VNVFHAGDGNLHPLILFDANDPDQFRRAEAFGADILETSVAMGGTITGEHGVGVLKARHLVSQLGDDVMDLTRRIKQALDPHDILNPGKWV
ncbi:MAG: FAD-linked oxidase C-terminal domain-containing protein, partial [Acidimicrobiales bacterium]